MSGHQFKFVVNNGESYIISNRYPIVKDPSGNQNNVYDPKRLKWTKKSIKLKQDFPHAIVDHQL